MKQALFLITCLIVGELHAETTNSLASIRPTTKTSTITTSDTNRYYPTRTTAIPKSAQTAATLGSQEYIRKVSLNVGGGMMLLDGDAYLGGNFGFLVRLDPSSPFYLGVDSGIYGIGHDTGNEFLIPLMATFMTRFDVHKSSFHPLLGLSVGTVFQMTTDETNGNATSTYFLGELRPGVEIDLAKSVSLSLEPRVGYMKSNIVFHPVIGLSIGL